jgi:hypothetical protein
MAIYTYVRNKRAEDTTSRLVFSTGKDMVIGEQVDLLAGEVTELSKVAALLDVQAGSIAVTVLTVTHH